MKIVEVEMPDVIFSLLKQAAELAKMTPEVFLRELLEDNIRSALEDAQQAHSKR